MLFEYAPEGGVKARQWDQEADEPALRDSVMVDAFEDHCWQDIIPANVLDLYRHYRRDLYIGPKAAVLAIDLYKLAYQGGPKPVDDVAKEFPSSCGINAWNALEPTKRVFAAARTAGLPIFHTTYETRPAAKPGFVGATNRRMTSLDPKVYEFQPEVAPQDGEV